MTERQAIKKSTTPAYFVVRFHADQLVSSLPKKNILKPNPESLSVRDDCEVKWSNGLRYEATVLKLAKSYQEAKKTERELSSQPVPSQLPVSEGPKQHSGSSEPSIPSPPPKKKRKTQERKNKENSKPKASPSDKFIMDLGSPPPQLSIPLPAPPLPQPSAARLPVAPIVLSPSEDGDSDVSEIELVSEQNVLEVGVALCSRSTQTSLSVKPPSGTVLCSDGATQTRNQANQDPNIKAAIEGIFEILECFRSEVATSFARNEGRIKAVEDKLQVNTYKKLIHA